MTRARTFRLLAALVVLAGVLAGPSTLASAESTPRARVAPNTCADGLGTAHVKLYAPDGQDSTFTTLLRSNDSGEIFRDEGRTAAAGGQASVAIPDLFYGDYDLEVFSGGVRILRDSLFVGCVPERPYKRAAWFGFSDACSRSTTYTVENRPIKGARQLLTPVHFIVFVDGGPKYLETDLPDDESDPYTAEVTIPWAAPGAGVSSADQVLVTVDGEPIDASGWATTDCGSDPQPPLPNTGS